MKKRFNQVPLTRYQGRYGEEITDVPEPKNGLIERMLGRRSARSFLPDPLPEGTLERLIAAAQSAPTSSMMQNWSVIHVTDPAVKQKIVDLGAEKIGERNIHMIRTAPVMLLWIADLHRLDKITWQTAAQGHTNTAELELSAIIDVTIAAQTLAVCAEAMALGTCYCGTMRSLELDFVKETFQLPWHTFVLFGMFVGKYGPDPTVPIGLDGRPMIKPRLPQHLVCHENQYKPLDWNDLRHYNDIMRDYFNDPTVPMENKIKSPGFDVKNNWINGTVSRVDLSKTSTLSNRMRRNGFDFK